jgi:hypothetical protein
MALGFGSLSAFAFDIATDKARVALACGCEATCGGHKRPPLLSEYMSDESLSFCEVR